MAWIAGERCERVPLERAGDPGGWHGRAQRFADGQIFPMAFQSSAFSEITQIVANWPFADRRLSEAQGRIAAISI